MATDYVSGLFGTQDWQADQDPEHWDTVIAMYGPKGTAPLQAIFAAMGSASIASKDINWFERITATMRGAITGIYTTPTLAVAYTSGGVSGTQLHVKMSADDAAQIRAGQLLLLRDASISINDHVVLVTAITKDGANSFATTTLLETDNNGSTESVDISDADVFMIIGNANAEGGSTPANLSRIPTKFENQTEIFWEPLRLTNTALVTDLRTDPGTLAEKQAETFERYMIQKEWANIFGVQSTTYDADGEEIRTMDGILTAIRANTSNLFDYRRDTDYSGDSWKQSGYDFLQANLEVLGRRGTNRKVAFCGGISLLGMTQLAETYGDIQLNPRSTEFGLDVVTWITPGFTIDLVRHPLFVQEATLRHAMLVLEPQYLKRKVLRPTKYLVDPNRDRGGEGAIDGIVEGWREECTLKYENIDSMGFFSGVGNANAV